MSVKELIEKYNAEEVGGRLVALVDGKRQYIADYDSSGFRLTEHGLRLEAGEAEPGPTPPVDAPRPTRKKREPKVEDTPSPAATKVEPPAPPPASDDLNDLLAGLESK